MGLTAAMEIGRSGLSVYQVAIEVTGENIANVNTEGYSRQKVNLASNPVSTANNFPLGTGVNIASVSRYYDGLLQQQLVDGASASAYDSTTAETLAQVEPVFNELTTDGLGSALTGFFNAWEDLSTNPAGTTERQGVISAAETLVDNFNSISTSLNNTISTLDQSLKSQADDINSTLTSIARLNGQIKQTELLSGNANEIRDQRDLLVRQLSENMGVSFTENTDGSTDIYVTDGSTTHYLVQGSQKGSITLGGSSPATTVTINNVAGGTLAVDTSAATPLYSAPDGGELWATLELRDTVIPGYLAQMDELANQVITQVNTLHQAGFDSSGTAGAAFFSGTTAGTMAVALSSPTGVAAASSSTTAPGGNGNALAIAQLKDASITFTSGNNSLHGFYNTLVSQVGLDVDAAKSAQGHDKAYMTQLSTLRESYSGVSLDEELTNLIMYQRSYQASSKLISTVSEMMDTLLSIV